MEEICIALSNFEQTHIHNTTLSIMQVLHYILLHFHDFFFKKKTENLNTIHGIEIHDRMKQTKFTIS
jgi:ABC-type cobalamin transport system ATPase subunit